MRSIDKTMRSLAASLTNYTNTIMREATLKVMGYVGTACFLVMPYVISHNYGLFLLFAISGNLLLLPQVYKAKAYNLVALNIIGGAGYIINAINLIFFT